MYVIRRIPSTTMKYVGRVSDFGWNRQFADTHGRVQYLIGMDWRAGQCEQVQIFGIVDNYGEIVKC